jgi:hypothetical protein
MGATGFCGICVTFGCISMSVGEYLCQGLQEAGLVYSWYHKLVRGW